MNQLMEDDTISLLGNLDKERITPIDHVVGGSNPGAVLTFISLVETLWVFAQYFSIRTR